MQDINYWMLFCQAIMFLIFGWFVRSYFPSYFAEKGKNLATKEDISRVTTEVEKVRLQYAADLERIKRELQQAAEFSNRYQNLQVQAYVDFIKATAGMAIAQKHSDPAKELDFIILLTDAKARIAIYGSRDVLLMLGSFFEDYGELGTKEGMVAFLTAIQKMREETVLSANKDTRAAISQMLFSQSL